MRTLPAGLKTHIEGRATTLCFCWKITRKDGLVQGFTNHDRDLVVAGQSYLARAGFTASQLESSLGLSVDNLTAEGALSDASISEEDLAAGRYDDADVELLLVNWSNPAQYVIEKRGSIGEVKRGKRAFQAEIRGLAHRLNQKTGRTFQSYCDACLGDSRCRVPLAGFTDSAAVTSAAGRHLTVSGVSGKPHGWFDGGVMNVVSGPNAGASFEVKRHTLTGGSVARIELWHQPPVDFAAGNALTLVAGCRKDFATCKTKFSNGTNFQGFPYIPGMDHLQKYPTSSDEEGAFDGGSLYGN